MMNCRLKGSEVCEARNANGKACLAHPVDTRDGYMVCYMHKQIQKPLVYWTDSLRVMLSRIRLRQLAKDFHEKLMSVKKGCTFCCELPWRRGTRDGDVCIGCRKPYRAENLGTIEDYMYKSGVDTGEQVNGTVKVRVR